MLLITSTNYRFTPQVAGKYFVIVQCWISIQDRFMKCLEVKYIKMVLNTVAIDQTMDTAGYNYISVTSVYS